jgi:hypothetical protein
MSQSTQVSAVVLMDEWPSSFWTGDEPMGVHGLHKWWCAGTRGPPGRKAFKRKVCTVDHRGLGAARKQAAIAAVEAEFAGEAA